MLRKIAKGARIALRVLFAHKLRTGLAVVGIVIGVASVTVMTAIGESTQNEVLKKIRALGTNLVVVTAGQVRLVAGKPRQTGNVSTLLMRDAKSIAEGIDYIAAVSPVQQAKLAVRYETFSTATMVVGAAPSIVSIANWRLAGGRMFNEDDDRTLQKVAVLGATVARSLFGSDDPVGARIQLRKVAFEVIGVFEKKGTDLLGNDQDDVVFIPINSALRRMFNLTYINNVYVQTVDSAHMERVIADIGGLLRERHRLKDKPDDFTIQSQSDIVKTEKNTATTFSRLIAAVAGISLLAGGAGIFAVMLISVRERTREIGLRRAVGALRRDILLQFLFESTALSLSGGIAGLAIGVAIAVTIASIAHWPLALPLAPMALTFASCAFMGVAFGVYPARKAALLDPIQALKTE